MFIDVYNTRLHICIIVLRLSEISHRLNGKTLLSATAFRQVRNNFLTNPFCCRHPCWVAVPLYLGNQPQLPSFQYNTNATQMSGMFWWYSHTIVGHIYIALCVYDNNYRYIYMYLSILIILISHSSYRFFSIFYFSYRRYIDIVTRDWYILRYVHCKSSHRVDIRHAEPVNRSVLIHQKPRFRPSLNWQSSVFVKYRGLEIYSETRYNNLQFIMMRFEFNRSVVLMLSFA